MQQASLDEIPSGFRQSCWRGLRFLHPVEWEPAALAGPKEPAKCVLVDRRYQRLQLDWQRLTRPPDLQRMYDRRQRSEQEHSAVALTGVSGWVGLVRTEEHRTVVEAGRFFAEPGMLVQAALIWPGRRDCNLERAVLTSIRPQAKAGTQLWQAVGLDVEVPAGYELEAVSSRVGCVAWTFRLPGRSREALSVERIAMPEGWLKTSLAEWLAGQAPKGYRLVRDSQSRYGGHTCVELHSRGGNWLKNMVAAGIYRLDRAWQCQKEQRVYRVSFWRKSSGEVELPAGLKVSCCRDVAGEAWK